MSEILVRSEEHAAMRHKRITGSRIATIMTGTPVGWDTLSAQLHNPEPEKFFTPEDSPRMPEQLQRGIKYEPMARAEFLMRHAEYELERPTFCVPGPDFKDDDLKAWVGMSPDGMLMHTGTGPDAENGGMETKVPSTETHLAWIEAGVLPTKYLPQCTISLLVTGLSHWWFISFCPEIEEDDPRRYFEVRLEREQTIIYLDTMRAKIREFLEGHINHRLFNKMPIEQTGGFPIIEWDITDARIGILIEEYGKLSAPTNSSDYAVVKAAHLDLVKRRTGVDKAYKRATEAARDYTTGAKEEQKRLQGLMAEIEAILKVFRGNWETEQQRKKDEAIALKAAKVEYLQLCVDAIRLLPADLHTMASGEIKEQIVLIKEIQITDDYDDFKEQAVDALNAALFAANNILADVIAEEKATAEAASIQAEKDAELLRLQKEAIERTAREAAKQAERDAAENVRKKKETEEKAERAAAEKKRELKAAAEQEKRDHQDKVRTNQMSINLSAMEAMTMDLEEVQKMLDWLLEIDTGDGQYGDDPDEVADLVKRAVVAVELILERKQHDLDTAEAERAENLAAEEQAAAGDVASGGLVGAGETEISRVATHVSSDIVDNAEMRQESLAEEEVEEEPMKNELVQVAPGVHVFPTNMCVVYQEGVIPDLAVATNGIQKGWLFIRHPDGKWITLVNMNDYFVEMKDLS